MFTLDPITVRKRPLDNYKIAPGDILNLAVVADTDPSLTLQYKWMFNDHQGNESEIKSNEYWKLSWPINKQLTIDVSNVTDPTILVSLAGYYIVKIYHNYDEKVINITVETDVFPTADIGNNYDSSNLNYYVLTCYDNFVFPKCFYFFKQIYESLNAT